MVIEDSIDTNTKGSFKKVSINKNGKEAKSILKPLKKLDCSSLIEIEILTGRTHQIRAQCEIINKNIANDKKYGCKDFNTRLKHSGIKRSFCVRINTVFNYHFFSNEVFHYSVINLFYFSLF